MVGPAQAWIRAPEARRPARRHSPSAPAPGRPGGAAIRNRKKRQPRASTGTTESMPTVRLRRRTGTAPSVTRNSPSHEWTTLGLPNRIGDGADQDRRADVAEQVEQEDAQGVAGGPPVGGDDVRRHRVARAEDRRQQDHRHEHEGERRPRVGVEDAGGPERDRDQDRQARHEQVGAPGVPQQEVGSPGPERDPEQAGHGGQAADPEPGLLRGHPADRLVERRTPGRIAPGGERDGRHPRRVETKLGVRNRSR